jgi:Zn-dependent protease with chaperone function
MIRFSGDYFDGQSSRAHPVTATFADGQLQIEGESIALSVARAQVEVVPPAGTARGVIHLPGQQELHSSDHAALAALAARGSSPERWARVLEGRVIYALGALLLSVLILFAGLRWGVPAGALLASHTLPDSLDRHIGEQSLRLMEKVSLEPSALPVARQRAISQRLAALCQQRATHSPCPTYHLLFRDSKLFGPNAMALPGGTVIVTDALVKLAKHDDEVLAVIAHELGHVQQRHSLRLALQSIGAGVILVAVTGDIGSVTDIAAGLPSLLLQNGYSRDMEREADAYALAWLDTACIPPRRFADLLGRIDKDASDTHLMSSHPGTRERIQPFRRPAACP